MLKRLASRIAAAGAAEPIGAGFDAVHGPPPIGKQHSGQDYAAAADSDSDEVVRVVKAARAVRVCGVEPAASVTASRRSHWETCSFSTATKSRPGSIESTSMKSWPGGEMAFEAVEQAPCKAGVVAAPVIQENLPRHTGLVLRDQRFRGVSHLQLPVLNRRRRHVELAGDVVEPLGVVALRGAEAILKVVGRRRLIIERGTH